MSVYGDSNLCYHHAGDRVEAAEAGSVNLLFYLKVLELLLQVVSVLFAEIQFNLAYVAYYHSLLYSFSIHYLDLYSFATACGKPLLCHKSCNPY